MEEREKGLLPKSQGGQIYQFCWCFQYEVLSNQQSRVASFQVPEEQKDVSLQDPKWRKLLIPQNTGRTFPAHPLLPTSEWSLFYWSANLTASDYTGVFTVPAGKNNIEQGSSSFHQHVLSVVQGGHKTGL